MVADCPNDVPSIHDHDVDKDVQRFVLYLVQNREPFIRLPELLHIFSADDLPAEAKVTTSHAIKNKSDAALSATMPFSSAAIQMRLMSMPSHPQYCL